MSKQKLVDFLLTHNQKQSEEFTAPDAVLARMQYRAKHPTEIAALKCMDGRLHLPLMTEIPVGIIQPFRNIGGKFDLGWPFFGLLMKEWIDYAVSRGRDAIVLVSYHFSKSDEHLGCKGFGYDTEAAKKATEHLRDQFDHIFGERHAVVYPIMIGIETDEDALILHGANSKEEYRLADLLSDTDAETLRRDLEKFFPDMKARILADLIPLLLGNLRHIAEVRRTKRPVSDIDHREQILGIGRGFDWLHLHNKALLVGPFSYDLTDPIAKAAGILLDNMNKGRIAKEDGVVLMSSAVYRESVGIERRLANEKAVSLAQLAVDVIKTDVPDLLPHVTVLAGTINLATRRFEKISFGGE